VIDNEQFRLGFGRQFRQLLRRRVVLRIERLDAFWHLGEQFEGLRFVDQNIASVACPGSSYSAESEPPAFEATLGMLVSGFFPEPVPPDLVLSVTLYPLRREVRPKQPEDRCEGLREPTPGCLRNVGSGGFLQREALSDIVAKGHRLLILLNRSCKACRARQI
jgi:hypothetical protein